MNAWTASAASHFDSREDHLLEVLRQPSLQAVCFYIGRWHGSNVRPIAVLDFFARMDPVDSALFWKVIAAEWSGFDAIPLRKYVEAFQRHRGAWTPDTMTPGDRSVFDSLPPLLTLYRGQDAKAPVGLAWTLRHDVAEGFARGHRGLIHRSPVVLTATVRKSSIALSLGDRDEAEVVVFRPPGGTLRMAPAAT